MPADEGLSAVGITALGVASARAVVSRRPDRLFDDPPAAKVAQRAQRELAEAFGSGAHGAAQAGPVDEEAVRAFPEYAAARTRYSDDCLLQASAAGYRQWAELLAGHRSWGMTSAAISSIWSKSDRSSSCR
ncbi:MAG: class I SAM-dependent methyltransferase [Pseudonocardiales bacterium]|nr:class I SAM-dependent methyltransferase [Pseudonocardiales bacterium]MBV9652198.1 class I SAM-dependent methyltransferase [Pseudonocardiales bacterium]